MKKSELCSVSIATLITRNRVQKKHNSNRAEHTWRTTRKASLSYQLLAFCGLYCGVGLIQALLDTSIINTQELVGSSSGTDIEGLSL